VSTASISEDDGESTELEPDDDMDAGENHDPYNGGRGDNHAREKATRTNEENKDSAHEIDLAVEKEEAAPLKP